MALSLTIGSPPVSQVQAGPGTTSTGTGSVTATLTTPSTAGTCLIAVVSDQYTVAGASTAPTGWALLKSVTASPSVRFEVWAYLSNPGGISSVVFTGNSGFDLMGCELSEWVNVGVASILEASGTATATSGTTLTPTTSSNVLTAGDLAISAWVQVATTPVPIVFTTPSGWTRLSAFTTTGNVAQDAEYQINPTTGATLGPVLTSDHTTQFAAGAIVVLKAAPPAADQATYIRFDTLNLALNTLDFELIDCPTAILAGAAVTLSDPGNYPDWVGTISKVTASDVVNLATGHQTQIIAATNTTPPNFTSSPSNLTDAPGTDTNDVWLLENGDSWQLENGSGNWLLESNLQEAGYADLSLGQQVGSVLPLTYTTLGKVRVYASDGVGFWPGMTFRLTSGNLASWVTAPGSLYTIQTITITYQGVPPVPVYDIQFGDRIQTLAEWTAAHA